MSKSESLSVIKKNIARCFGDDLSACERMSAVLDEAVRLAAPGTVRELREKRFSAEELRREFPVCLPTAPASLLDETPEENLALATAKVAAAEGAYLAAYCTRIAAQLKAAKLRVGPSLFLPQGGRKAGGDVAMLETEAFRRAFALLSGRQPDMTPRAVRSFADACDAVCEGDCVYCILPLENSRDGLLSATLRIIVDNDLFISRVCEIADESGVATRFALLCRDTGAAPPQSGAQQITIRLAQHGPSAMPRLFTGLAVTGASLVRVTSQPLAYTDGYAQICTFSGTREALFSWLLLLEIVKADYTLLGVYETLKEQ